MKAIQHHVIDANSARLMIFATDDPGAGGARHEYLVEASQPLEPGDLRVLGRISFQNGPIAEHGINGVTIEALLAVCIDRLKDFQAGAFTCRENALALTKLEEALHWLHHRTLDRVRRQVEGTSKQ